MNRVLLFVFCLAAFKATAQSNEAITIEGTKINQLLAQASLQTKSEKRYDYIAVNNGMMIVTDSLFMRGYDKKFDLYLKRHHVLLKDIADVIFEKKIAALWCRIVLKPGTTSYKYFNYEGKEEENREGILFILDKSFSKGDGPDQLKEAFRKLFVAAGLSSPF